MCSSALRFLTLSAAVLAYAAPDHASTPAGSASALRDESALTVPCSPAGAAFCWLNPLPQGSTLTGVWAAREDDAWAVGAPGTLLHWDGRALTPVTAPTSAPLRSVWGSAGDDVWAAGDAVAHFDGRAWSNASAPASAWSSVHGSSPDDVWLVGAAGAAAHFDGTSWTRVETGVADDLAAVAVVSPIEAYAAAAHGGAVLRWDGSSWSVATRLAVRSLLALFAPGPGDVWAAGEPLDGNPSAGAARTSLAHLSQGAWTSVTVPGLENAIFTAVHASSAAGLWVAAMNGSGAGRAAHLDGSGWHVEELPSPALAPRSVQVVGGSVLTVGDGGQAFARGASGWAPLHHGTPGYLQSATFTSAGDAWFGAVLPDFSEAKPEARLLHLRRDALETVPVGIADVVYGVWANGPDDVWAGTLTNGFLHYDGKAWTSRVGGYAGLVDGVWASGPDDVWGAAGSYAVHFDGATVTRHPLPGGGARRIFGLSPRDVWAVGGTGVVQHWDGAAWSAVAIAGTALAVWGSASDDVWLVGEGGLALHWDGHAMTPVASGTNASLWAVRGGSRSDVWVAGAEGTLLHFDGTSFARVESGTSNTLGAIAAGPGGELYVAGDFGTILSKAN